MLDKTENIERLISLNGQYIDKLRQLLVDYEDKKRGRFTAIIQFTLAILLVFLISCLYVVYYVNVIDLPIIFPILIGILIFTIIYYKIVIDYQKRKARLHQLHNEIKAVFTDLYKISKQTSQLKEHALKNENAVYQLEIELKLIEAEDLFSRVIELTDLDNSAFNDTEQFVNASDATIQDSYNDIRSTMRQAIIELEDKEQHKDRLLGIPTGFVDLDRVTFGWQKTDLIVVAARPGMGKTSFILSALRNAAVDFGHSVAVFSLDLSSVQLTNRLISAEAELEDEKIRRGNLREDEWQQLYAKTVSLTEAPIFIDDSPTLSVQELRLKCRRLKAQHNIELVAIDYLQLLKDDSLRYIGGDKEQEISSVMSKLRGLAKELDTPVIILSQLDISLETRGGDKRPQLSDLSKFGHIEQYADMVIFLYRPEYYGLTEDSEGNPVQGICETIISKHRNGARDTVKLRFIGEYHKFTNLDEIGLSRQLQSAGVSEKF